MRCDKCRWWHKEPDSDAISDEGVGECRRFPPQILENNPGDGEPNGMPWGTHPLTFGYDWCGEFTPCS